MQGHAKNLGKVRERRITIPLGSNLSDLWRNNSKPNLESNKDSRMTILQKMNWCLKQSNKTGYVETRYNNQNKDTQIISIISPSEGIIWSSRFPCL